MPAFLVARAFDLQYSVTGLQLQADGETVQGGLVWIRAPGHILPDRVSAGAATSGAILDRYTDYLKDKKETDLSGGTASAGTPANSVEVEGISLYLCLAWTEAA